MITGYIIFAFRLLWEGIAVLPKIRYSQNLSYIKGDRPNGTAGSLRLVPDLTKTFLVLNGDILTTLDYTKLVSYHREKGGILTIGMHRKRIKIDLGVIDTDNDGYLLSYAEKPEKVYDVSMGIYVYEPAVLKYIVPNQYLDFPDLVLRLVEAGEKVVGFPGNCFWLDIGRQEDYVQAQEEYERMKNAFLPNAANNAESTPSSNDGNE